MSISVQPVPYKGNDRLLFGIIMGVVAFWLFAQTTLNIAPEQEKTVNKIPSNHSPKFAPQIHPTLETGLQAMLTAAGAWLCPRTAA